MHRIHFAEHRWDHANQEGWFAGSIDRTAEGEPRWRHRPFRRRHRPPRQYIAQPRSRDAINLLRCQQPYELLSGKAPNITIPQLLNSAPSLRCELAILLRSSQPFARRHKNPLTSRIANIPPIATTAKNRDVHFGVHPRSTSERTGRRQSDGGADRRPSCGRTGNRPLLPVSGWPPIPSPRRSLGVKVSEISARIKAFVMPIRPYY